MNSSNRYLRVIICLIVTAFTVCALDAQTVMWSVRPTYDKITTYAVPNTFMCTIDGRHGLIHADGTEWVPICADYIVESYEGMSLAINETNQDGFYKVLGIIDNNKQTYTPINEAYYTKSYPCFSEGLLCVCNNDVKFGYIDKKGNVVIKPQFKDAYPFNCGLALVNQTGRDYMYIRPSFDSDKRPQIIKFNNGKFDYATSFKNGEAFVKYGSKAAYINSNGEIVRKYEGNINDIVGHVDIDRKIKDGSERAVDEFGSIPKAIDVQTHMSNNLYGIYMHEGINIPAQFEEIQDFYGDYAIVRHNSKYGVIKRILSSVVLENATNKVVQEYNKRPTDVKFAVNIPNEYDADKFDIEFKIGGNTISDVSVNRAQDGTYYYEFTPTLEIGEDWIDVEHTIKYDDIVLSNSKTKTEVSYPVRIDISNIRALSSRANENDIQTISATITNYSAIPISMVIMIDATSQTKTDEHATITKVKNSKPITLRSGGQTTINVGCHVETKFTSKANVVVMVNNKQCATKPANILMQPYYE